MADKVFDSIVFKSQAGYWLVADNFAQTKKKNRVGRFEWLVLKAIKKLKKWPITGILGRFIQYGYGNISKCLNRRYLYDWQSVEKHGACLLYDVYEESKPYILALMKQFSEVPKFSIQHGININDGGVVGTIKKVPDGDQRKDVKAYLFSPKERPLYEHKYAIDNSRMEVVGVPRHNPDWMEFIRLSILEQSKGNIELKSGSIFIISRPGGTHYHPYDRKKKALENIKRLAWNDLNKNIVIKLHPKEKKEGIYEEVFGTESYGDKWVYSDLHPFVLGKESAFAISFYSGVPVDMLALGVPTIEYLDLRGIPEYDNDESLRDKIGHPCFSYRYLNLVLGASDYHQLKAHALEILNDRETVISRLQAKYNELFPQIDNVNDKITQDILNLSAK